MSLLMLLLLAQFNYDAKEALAVDASEVELVEGARLQEISYASPKGGRVPGYLIAPQGAGPHAGIVFVHWGQGNRTEFVAATQAAMRRIASDATQP